MTFSLFNFSTFFTLITLSNVEFFRCHLRSFDARFDFLKRDISGEIRRPVFRFHVNAERRKAAVVGRVEPFDGNVF